MTEQEKDNLKHLLKIYTADVTWRRDNASLDAIIDKFDDLLTAASDILTDLSGWEG